MNRSFAALVPLLLATLVSAAPVVGERGPARAIEPHFVGFNQNFMGQVDPWNDRLVGQLKTTGGANFRYPAGTVGSYWNWRTGRVDETLVPEDVMTWVRPHVRGGPRAGQGRYTLDNFKRAVDGAQVAPVFMLGMAVHALEEQIAILKEAEKSGLPIKYLELGNELIFKDAEPLLEKLFPDAETYGRVASEWVAALEAAFPGVKVAVCGSFVASDSQSERRRTWNPRMMKTLQGAKIITTHLYAGEIVRTERERLGLSEVQAQQALTAQERAERAIAPTPDNTAKTVGLAYEVWEQLLTKTQMPPGMEVWVTEWNSSGLGGSEQHWMSGLVTAAFLDAFLRTNVTLTCHHTMGSVFERPEGNRGEAGARPNAGTGGNAAARGNAANAGTRRSSPGELNAAGVTLREFASAMNGRTRARELRFPSVPAITLTTGRTYAGVAGWAFGHADVDTDETAVLINFSAQPVTIATDPLGVKASRFRQIAGSVDATVTTLQPEDGAVAAELTLPPHSVTILARN